MYHENFIIITTCQICKIVSASSNRSTIEPNQISKFKTLHFYQKVFSIIIYLTQIAPPPSESRISHYNAKCPNTKLVLVPHSTHKIPHDLILPYLCQRLNYGVISPETLHVISLFSCPFKEPIFQHTSILKSQIHPQLYLEKLLFYFG